MDTAHNPHLARPMLQEGPAPAAAAAAAVLVHGRGQSPDYMRAIAARIGIADVHRVYPAAANNSWYPGRFVDPLHTNEPWLGHALQALDAALGNLVEAGLGPEQTILIGFSQGACLVAEHIIQAPQAYHAVVLLTGGHLGPDSHPITPRGTLPGTPVLLSSSVVDEWVPPHRVRATADLLRAMGATVTTRLHDSPEHGVSDDEIGSIREMLTTVLSR